MNEQQDLPTITIYTDGACSGNPGPGGWGALMLAGEHRRELRGGEIHTTNNRMELMAAIKALEALKRPSHVDLHTDSTYLRKGITEWIFGWKRNGWKTADKKAVKNADLWLQLDDAQRRHEIEWHWVKGHAGHPGNERADELARLGMQDLLSEEAESGANDNTQPAIPTAEFELDSQLAADTFEVARLELCSLRLMNDQRYPWLVLVPMQPGLTEITDLTETDSRLLMREIRLASSILDRLGSPDKINVGALGNIVRQLHIHVIARSKDDPAWPDPVWGHGEPSPYDDKQRQKFYKQIEQELLRG